MPQLFQEIIMNTRIRQSAAIIALSSAALMAATLPAHAQNAAANAPAAQQATTQVQSDWLNLRQVYDKLEAAGYTDIREIDRERGGYEAKARDSEGRKVKLYIDPRSGEVLNRKTRDND